MPRPRADGLRLALTTLTVLPVRGPARVDRRTGRAAMLLAPVVGLGLGGAAALVQLGARAATGSETTLLPAVLAVATLALLTRGLHLDGLADTVDALASYRRGGEALAVARSGDTGPLGVAAVVLVLLVDVAALAAAVAAHTGTVTLVAAVISGRVALPVACRVGVPLGEGSRLGALVVGTVPRVGAGAVVAAAALGCATAAALDPHAPSGPGWPLRTGLAPLLGVGAAVLLGRHCTRRFGGVTGDVLGAQVETATLVTLLVLAAHG